MKKLNLLVLFSLILLTIAVESVLDGIHYALWCIGIGILYGNLLAKSMGKEKSERKS